MRGSGTDAGTDAPEIPGVADLSLIGRGGSGLVYRGRQEALGRDVAVKILATPPATKSTIERWQRELNAMGRLSNHPNIVAVYDSGLTADGRPYLVMPFVPGGTLGDRVRSTGPLDPVDAVGIGIKIANALSAAHVAGVLHRDVKPDNVLLSPYEPQLADFGIARLVDTTTTSATTAGLIHATINYAAPEVLAGDSASEASDVYSLAATLYTAMSGEVPFPHGADANAVAVAHQIIHNPAPLLDAGVPDRVAAAIARGMAKDPSERPSSAELFADELELALRDGDRTVIAAVPVTERVTAAVPPRIERRVDRPAPARRRSSPVGVFAIAAVVVAVAGVLLLMRGTNDGSRAGSHGASTTVAAPSVGNAATTAARPHTGATGAVAETARGYFTRISQGDYAGAYAMLSPAFRAGQSQASFESFWRSVSPVSIAGPVTTTGLTARVPLRMASRDNTYTLTMIRGASGVLYIDGPRPR